MRQTTEEEEGRIRATAAAEARMTPGGRAGRREGAGTGKGDGGGGRVVVVKEGVRA